MSGSGHPTLPLFSSRPYVIPFIVCYKIKQEGFDFHVYFISLYHPLLSISKNIPTYPTYFREHVTGTRHIFYLALLVNLILDESC